MCTAQIIQAPVIQARFMPTPPGFEARPSVAHIVGDEILVELSDSGGEGCA
jgi:hypothetical protein